MEYNISGIIINTTPDPEQIRAPIPEYLKHKYASSKIGELTPQKLVITFIRNSTLLLLDMITYKNMSGEAELTSLEKDVAAIFPTARIFIFVVNNRADLIGYSLLENGKKLRTKCVANDVIKFDFGDFNAKENELYEAMRSALVANPAVNEKFEATTATYDPMQKKKFHLLYRDAVLRNKRVDNEFGYVDGSLDEYIIETEFKLMAGCGFTDLDGMEAVKFDKKKFDFTQESFRDYINVARKVLPPSPL